MKTTHFIYWCSTSLLSALMLFAAFNYLSGAPAVHESFRSLGYPDYFPLILGVAKIAGVVVLLIPGAAMWKEWAYAGFTITFVAAMISHAFMQQFGAMVMPLVALALLIASYASRPLSRHVLSRVVMQEIDEHGHTHTVFRPTSAH